MRSIQVYFDDEDFERLEKQKGDLSWREYIMKLLEKN